MYALIFILGPTFLGDYRDLNTCQNAIREIYAQRINPPHVRLKELEPAIDFKMQTNKDFLCVKKG